MAEKAYHLAVNKWRSELDQSIRKENGWLALAGLFWLKLGKNYFGSDPKCEVQLPERLPAGIGYFENNGRLPCVQIRSRKSA